MKMRLFPLSAKSRWVAIALSSMLAATDIWLISSMTRDEVPAVTISVREYFPVLDGKWSPDAFRLERPAQLNRLGNGWLVDGKQVPNLTKYIEQRVAKGKYPAGYIDNYSVDLGSEKTFGRALTALKLLAHEGTCDGAILNIGSEMQPVPWEIITTKDQVGHAVLCRPKSISDFTVSAEAKISDP